MCSLFFFFSFFVVLVYGVIRCISCLSEALLFYHQSLGGGRDGGGARGPGGARAGGGP